MKGKIITTLGGVLMGTAGVAVFSSKDAKKAYTHIVAAVLRGKDSVMKTVSLVKENCDDIYADANDLNEKRYEEEKEAKLKKAKAIIEQYEHDKEGDVKEATE